MQFQFSLFITQIVLFIVVYSKIEESLAHNQIFMIFISSSLSNVIILINFMLNSKDFLYT